MTLVDGVVGAVGSVAGAGVKTVSKVGGTGVKAVSKVGGVGVKAVTKVGGTGIKAVSKVGEVGVKTVTTVGDVGLKTASKVGHVGVKTASTAGKVALMPAKQVGKVVGSLTHKEDRTDDTIEIDEDEFDDYFASDDFKAPKTAPPERPSLQHGWSFMAMGDQIPSSSDDESEALSESQDGTPTKKKKKKSSKKTQLEAVGEDGSPDAKSKKKLLRATKETDGYGSDGALKGKKKNLRAARPKTKSVGGRLTPNKDSVLSSLDEAIMGSSTKSRVADGDKSSPEKMTKKNSSKSVDDDDLDNSIRGGIRNALRRMSGGSRGSVHGDGSLRGRRTVEKANSEAEIDNNSRRGKRSVKKAMSEAEIDNNSTRGRKSIEIDNNSGRGKRSIEIDNNSGRGKRSVDLDNNSQRSKRTGLSNSTHSTRSVGSKVGKKKKKKKDDDDDASVKSSGSKGSRRGSEKKGRRATTKKALAEKKAAMKQKQDSKLDVKVNEMLSYLAASDDEGPPIAEITTKSNDEEDTSTPAKEKPASPATAEATKESEDKPATTDAATSAAATPAAAAPATEGEGVAAAAAAAPDAGTEGEPPEGLQNKLFGAMGGKSRWDKLKISAKFVGKSQVSAKFTKLFEQEEKEEEDENCYIEGEGDTSGSPKKAAAPKVSNAEVDRKLALIEDMERQLKEQREEMDKEKEKIAFERESLEMQLNEEIQKTEALQKIIDDGFPAGGPLSPGCGDGNQESMLELSGENEALKARLEVERRDSRLMRSKLESETIELKQTIEKMREEEDAANEASSGMSSMPMGRLHGELLQVKSKLADRESTIQRQRAQMEEMSEELVSHREGSGVENLKKELAELKAREKEREAEITKERAEMDKKLESKDETIKFLIDEMGKLKQQVSEPPATSSSGWTFASKKSDGDMALNDDDSVGEKDPLDNSTHSAGALFMSMFGASPGTLTSRRLEKRAGRRPPPGTIGVPAL